MARSSRGVFFWKFFQGINISLEKYRNNRTKSNLTTKWSKEVVSHDEQAFRFYDTRGSDRWPCYRTRRRVCLWPGMMRLIEKSGMLDGFCWIIAPVMRRLFPDIPPHSTAMSSIVMNIAANLLGLSNAATSIGLRAMEQMQKLNGGGVCASRSMMMFVVMNTASFQLLSSSFIALRIEAGSADPFEAMVPIWMASAI